MLSNFASHGRFKQSGFGKDLSYAKIILFVISNLNQSELNIKQRQLKKGSIMNYKKTVKSILLALILALWGIGGSLHAEEIMVSAAVSLKNAFEEMAGQFQQIHSGQTVSFNFGASGDLATQIIGGAPADIFASAAQKDMNGIEKKGLWHPAPALILRKTPWC